jgi:hypothetical protein
MIKVTCKVENYDQPMKQSLIVEAHWNDDKMIVLVIDGKNYTVIASDLKAAIDNCTNTNRF